MQKQHFPMMLFVLSNIRCRFNVEGCAEVCPLCTLPPGSLFHQAQCQVRSRQQTRIVDFWQIIYFFSYKQILSRYSNNRYLVQKLTILNFRRRHIYMGGHMLTCFEFIKNLNLFNIFWCIFFDSAIFDILFKTFTN